MDDCLEIESKQWNGNLMKGWEWEKSVKSMVHGADENCGGGASTHLADGICNEQLPRCRRH